MDKDLKKIIALSSEALAIMKRRAKSEIAVMKRKGLKREQIAEVTKKTAAEAYSEGKRLKTVYQRELTAAMDRLQKLAKIEAGVIARRIKKIRKKR